MTKSLSASAPAETQPPGLTAGARRMLLFAMLAASSSTPILFTVLPAFGEQTGLDATATGALLTMSGLAFAIAAPVWGRLADRWGRARVLSVGLVGYGLAFLLFAVLAQLGLAAVLTGTGLFLSLLFTRPIGGGLAAAVPPASLAVIADRTSLAQRAAGMALIGTATGLGLLVGPAIGAFGGLVGVLAPVWVLGVLSIALGLMVPFVLPDVPRSGASTAGAAPKMKMTDGRSLPWLLATFAVFGVVAVVGTTTGYLIRDRFHTTIDQTTAQTGIYLVVAGIGLAGVQSVLRKRMVTPVTLLVAGGLTAGVGLALYGIAPHIIVLLIGGLLQGAGVGLLLPGLYGGASLTVGPAHQGAVGGLVTFAQASAFAAGPLAGGALYEAAPNLFPVIGVLIFGSVAALAWRARRRPAPVAPAAGVKAAA